MNYTPKRVAIFLEWSKGILSNEWDTSLNFLCHSWTYLHRQVFFLPCNLETLLSQQIFALPFSNDNVSKPSWVCPAHFVLIIVPFLPLKFSSFFQSKHVNSISLISEADEVHLTSLRQRKEKIKFGHIFFCHKVKVPQRTSLWMWRQHLAYLGAPLHRTSCGHHLSRNIKRSFSKWCQNTIRIQSTF